MEKFRKVFDSRSFEYTKWVPFHLYNYPLVKIKILDKDMDRRLNQHLFEVIINKFVEIIINLFEVIINKFGEKSINVSYLKPSWFTELKTFQQMFHHYSKTINGNNIRYTTGWLKIYVHYGVLPKMFFKEKFF